MGTGTAQAICIGCGEAYNIDCGHTCKQVGPNYDSTDYLANYWHYQYEKVVRDNEFLGQRLAPLSIYLSSSKFPELMAGSDACAAAVVIIQRQEAELKALKNSRAILLELAQREIDELLTIEWIKDDRKSDRYWECPWCHMMKFQGHAEDCVRGMARKT